LLNGDRKGEHGRQMHYMLNALNETKDSEQSLSMGILLWKRKDKITADYILKESHKPAHLAAYRSMTAPPTEMKQELPSLELLSLLY